MWNRVEDHTIEEGRLLVLVHPKHDREAHTIEVEVLARRGPSGTMSYQMIKRGSPAAIGVYYLDTINDYTITYWKHFNG